MACCAAAAFFLSQIALAFEAVRRRIFGARPQAAQRNDAVAWTLGSPIPEGASRPSRIRGARKLIVAALVAEAVLVAGTATAWTAYSTPGGNADEHDLWSLAMDSICTSGSTAESRNRLNNWIEGSSN